MSGKLDWGKNNKNRRVVENGSESVDGGYASPGIGKATTITRGTDDVIVIRRGSSAAATAGSRRSAKVPGTEQRKKVTRVIFGSAEPKSAATAKVKQKNLAKGKKARRNRVAKGPVRQTKKSKVRQATGRDAEARQAPAATPKTPRRTKWRTTSSSVVVEIRRRRVDTLQRPPANRTGLPAKKDEDA